ncbi:MAG: tetratricopeptide repeat protein [Verrucomicrobiota bacterium]
MNQPWSIPSFGRGLVLLALVLLPALAAVASDSPTAEPTKVEVPAHAEPTPAPAKAEAPSSEGVNRAFRESAQLLATTNLLGNPPEENAAAKTADYPAMLEQGSQLKRDKNYAAAEIEFVAVLKGAAPAELQRTAMLELALLAQENQQPTRAQQIFSQYLDKYSDDPSAAEVYLRQGLLYRQMGAPNLALSKFYAVMTTALRLKLDRLDYYQRLVLQAQTEIADTYYLQGKFGEAAEFLGRLLKLNSPLLNQSQIIYKLIRSLSCLNRHNEVIAQAEFFITKFPEAPEVAEVRFLYADSLKKLGRTRDALRQVLVLLQTQQTTATNQPGNWVYWQQRTGNEIANQLYKEGDYVNALEIYLHLADLNETPSWQIPVWYQMGLVYERLMQPQKATEIYERILARQKELDSGHRTPSLDAVLDMARWRIEQLKWQMKTEEIKLGLNTLPAADVALRAK